MPSRAEAGVRSVFIGPAFVDVVRLGRPGQSYPGPPATGSRGGPRVRAAPLLPDDVGEQAHPAVLAFLRVHALDLVREPGEAGVALLEQLEVGDHGRGALVPALAGHHDADARRVYQRHRR